MVSVLLLSWNHEKYIERSIRSVLDQAYRDIEILYMDNHSADRTFPVAENMLRNAGITFRAFRREEACSIPCNFNYLFRQSAGEFVCLLSGDDWLMPENISEKLKPFERHNDAALVYSDGFMYHDDVDAYTPLHTSRPGKGPFLQELLQENFIAAPGCVIRSAALQAVGGWDEDLRVEDWDLWIRLAMQFRIEKVDRPLFFYRRHSSGISADSNFMYAEKKKIFEKYLRINQAPTLTERAIWKSCIGEKARDPASLKVAAEVLSRFRPEAFYIRTLIKALTPAYIKRRYFIRGLQKKNCKKEIRPADRAAL